jgi:drug/metabolite transporter (DMT)-like permease
MAIVLALLAAAANAFATVLQRLGVEQAVRKDASTRALMSSVLRRPVWFVGLSLTTASFLLQAVALSLGNLSTVQPVMVTEILFLVVILGVWFHKALGWREWIGAVGTSVGLGAFLALSSARGGTSRPAPEDWLLLVTASSGAVLVALGASRRGTRSWKAACFGVAAAVCFALTAACIKSTADQWSRGPVFIFSHVGTYGIAVAGLLGLIVSQHALEAGPVAASQSSLLIVNPIASIVMGVFLFGDRLQLKGGRFAVEVVSLGVMFLSLYVLSHSPLITSSAAGEDLSARSMLQKEWGGLPT